MKETVLLSRMGKYSCIARVQSLLIRYADGVATDNGSTSARRGRVNVPIFNYLTVNFLFFPRFIRQFLKIYGMRNPVQNLFFAER